MYKLINIEVKKGIRTALADGTLVPDSPKHMATEHLYKASAGDRITILSREYLYAVALFSPERDHKYIYTYDYQREANWTTYQRNVTPDSYTDKEYIFEKEAYFRICLKRRDGQDVKEEDAEKAGKSLRYEALKTKVALKPCFLPEIGKTVKDIREKRKQSLVLCVLTDTHYTVNGTWEDTALNIKAVHEQVHFDEIIHLGDVTDGVTSAKVTADYTDMVQKDLHSCNIPVRMVLGNHDANYFYRNPDQFTIEEQVKLYLKESTVGNKPHYYVDYKEHNLRCLFLHSFCCEEPIRYGFAEEELAWVQDTLESMGGGDVIVFSHDAPFAELDYWSFLIRNGEQLMEILEDYNRKEEYHVLGYFHGHTHADFVYDKCSFPIVSIGCAKCEYFADKKPEGAIAPERIPDTVSQDLWDTMIIDSEAECIHMIRFGAGKDRRIDCAKKKSIRKELLEEKRRGRKTKIWAHRGASAYAPENTLPAFALAAQLRSDGVELDVHLTKDGIPVVIHDERIDRVSDGKGLVRDYTLIQLKCFNFNLKFPAYGRVEIPTLEEVYELVKDMKLIINLELKNHSYFYEGLEEKVLELTQKYRLEDRVIYSSFNHSSMVYLKELKNDVRIAFLYRDGFLDIPGYAERNGAYAVHPDRESMKYPELLVYCREKNIKVHVWNVEEEEDMKRMVRAGVQGLITNQPDRAVSIVENFAF